MRNFKLANDPFQLPSLHGYDALFTAIFDESPDAIFLLNPGNFKILDCNAKALKLFEISDKSELKEKDSFALYESEPVEFSKNIFIDTINKGDEHSQELAFKSLKGNVFWGKCSIRKVVVEDGAVIIFRVRRVVDYMKTAEMLSEIIKQTSRSTGCEYFKALTGLLSKSFGVSTAMIARINRETRMATVVNCWYKTQYTQNLTFEVDKSPSGNVLKGYSCFYPCNLKEMFPEDPLIKKHGFVAYLGTPVFDMKGDVGGVLILMDDKPMEEIPNSRYILSIFSSRIGAEFERMEIEENYQRQIRELTNKAN